MPTRDSKSPKGPSTLEHAEVFKPSDEVEGAEGVEEDLDDDDEEESQTNQRKRPRAVCGLAGSVTNRVRGGVWVECALDSLPLVATVADGPNPCLVLCHSPFCANRQQSQGFSTPHCFVRRFDTRQHPSSSHSPLVI